MGHPVICVYCNEKFDRDKEPAVLISSRRYAHKKCADKYGPKKTQEEEDLEKLEKYIMKLFNEPYINAKIRKQIKEYRREYNYSYSGMLKTLVYWYEVKGNSIENSNYGVGIIPHVYATAHQYYYNLYLIKLSNQNKDIEKYKPKERIIEISSPMFKGEKKVKLFNLEDDDDDKVC